MHTSRRDAVGSLEDAFIFGYPLVLMGAARARATAPGSNGFRHASLNEFTHVRELPTERSRTPMPNTDTLCSSAWLDVGDEPVILSVPDVAGRYYVMTILDMWTAASAAPGVRSTGTAASNFAIVGPDWSGALPAGVRKLQVPTNSAWIAGRTQACGRDDVSLVNAMQAKYRLTPLSSWGVERLPRSSPFAEPTPSIVGPPVASVNAMDPRAFFGQFARLMVDNPPYPSDAALVERMEQSGIVAGEEPDWRRLGPDARSVIDEGARRGLARIRARAAASTACAVDNWLFADAPRKANADYVRRAAGALAGLGSAGHEDEVRALSRADCSGRPYTGSHGYTLRFEKGQAPPVNAFWSLTIYDDNGFLVENPIGRYAIGDRDPLVRDPHGSVTLRIQRRAPSHVADPNWLPAPRGRFTLVLRMYWPKRKVLRGRWKPPAVTRFD